MSMAELLYPCQVIKACLPTVKCRRKNDGGLQQKNQTIGGDMQIEIDQTVDQQTRARDRSGRMNRLRKGTLPFRQ